MRRFALLLVLLLALVVGALVLSRAQGRLVYFPTREIEAAPSVIGLEYRDVWLQVDGQRVHAWLNSARGERLGTVLFFHGNAGNISHRQQTMLFWAHHGMDLMIVDYPGYGQSEGRPTEANTYATAQAAWDFLTAQEHIPADEIVVHARSLGGGIGTWLASQEHPRALILESSFLSIPDMAQELFPWVPRWMVRIRYPSRDRIAGIQCPVLIAHSREDEVIPYRHGRGLFDAAREPKMFLELQGGHNGGWTQTADYDATVRRFLTDAGLEVPTP
jgi:alpha-beta hydrolase superfamily lysophospholipase